MSTKSNASNISIFYRIFDFLSIYIGVSSSFYILSTEIIQKDVFFITLLESLFFILLCEITNFYRSSKGKPIKNQFEQLFANLLLCHCATFLIFNINGFQDMDYHSIILSFLISCFSAFSLRILIRLSYRYFLKKFYRLQNTMIIGNSERAKQVFLEIENSKWRGYNNIGLYSISNEQPNANFSGNFLDAKKLIQENKVDKVYLTMDHNNLSHIEELLVLLTDSTCSTVLVPNLYHFEYLYTKVEDLNKIPTIPLIDTDFDGLNGILKRLEDIVLSLCILTLISPLLLLIATLIKSTSKGPVLFKQTRYGLNGKPINVFKFRTMNVMENGSEVVQAVKNDHRITKIGGLLRRSSLDELPQFFNVLLGSMSIVGPRPHAVSHNEQYRKLIPGYMLRHKVKPGITGLAQIRGWRGETDTIDKMEKRVECDLIYIRNWSIWLDIKIIILTIFHGFVHKAAY